MQVLLTGASGYIGTTLARTLVAKSVSVTGLDAGFFDVEEARALQAAIPTLRKDVRDLTVTDLEPFDTVVHLAGIPEVAEPVIRQKAIHQINYRATIRLASLSKFAGVSGFVHLSNANVDSYAGNSALQDLAPHRSGMANDNRHKVETDVARLADVGFSPVFVRAPVVYGPSSSIRVDNAINWMMFEACTTGAVPVPANRNARDSAVYIQDLADALAYVILSDRHEMHSQTFTVADAGSSVCLADLAARIAALVPGASLRYDAAFPSSFLQSCVDVSRHARRNCVWHSSYSLDEGLVALRDYIWELVRRNPDQRMEAYNRTIALQHLIESGEVTDDLRWQRETTAQRKPTVVG